MRRRSEVALRRRLRHTLSEWGAGQGPSARSDGAIGHLTLNRPEKLNPLSSRALSELAAAARWFDTQTAVKVVIVRSASNG